MATETSGSAAQPAGRRSDGQTPIRVYGCSRLGRQANPPAAHTPLGDWLRRR